ncbi:hypothetical protein OH809_30430 [Streptomyces sp. NBC_00873]|uniref:hypothetical protein n=1 Tax=unclassified Streptomyces TaxID=2593676 RepID=UPI00386730B9|nr:hypothetical protein OH809_30430 [Streptomyces sp. NBC_00873]WTA43476.1 hypothetical protein OH821_13280 [Streptomyces sp. NBC_00842]
MSPKWSAMYGQLLLFAALLFGIFTMHTVGHPAEHSGHEAVRTTDHVRDQGAQGIHPASSTTEPSVEHASVPPTPMGDGTDPMAACLALLGAWGLALLAGRLMALRTAENLLVAAGALLSRALRSGPPPAMTVPARLSVLRI